MRRKMWMLLCSMMIGLLMTGGLVYMYQTQLQEVESCVEDTKEQYAWWSLTYERPNPDRLPVQVRFQWLKGLE